MRIWSDGTCLKVCEGHTLPVRSISSVPSTKGFVTTDNGGTMIWWAEDGGVLQKVDEAHSSYIFASASNPRTSEVFTAGDDGLLKVWKFSGGKAVCVQSIGLMGEV